MIEPNAILIANGFLAIFLFGGWYNHIVRYKWKLVRAIAALEYKIEKQRKSNTLHNSEYYNNSAYYIVQRITLKNELYDLQKLTDYSGFR